MATIFSQCQWLKQKTQPYTFMLFVILSKCSQHIKSYLFKARFYLNVNINHSQISRESFNDSKGSSLCCTPGTSPPSMVLTFLPFGAQQWTSISVNQLWYIDLFCSPNLVKNKPKKCEDNVYSLILYNLAINMLAWQWLEVYFVVLISSHLSAGHVWYTYFNGQVSQTHS